MRMTLLNAFANLELSLEADAWVQTLSSNWCRMVDELRMTVGGKAHAVFVTLNRGHGVNDTACGAEVGCYLKD